MTDYKPQKGDRVRVVLEGEVTYINPDGAFDIDNWKTVNPADMGVVSVEKATPPLPTTPGSHILAVASGIHWLLRRDGFWVSDCDYRCVEETPPEGYEVIFDAGKENK